MALLQTIPIWQAFAITLPLLYAALRLAERHAPASALAPGSASNRPSRIPCSAEPNSLFRAAEFPVPEDQGIRPQGSDFKPEKQQEPASKRTKKIKIRYSPPDNREIPPPDIYRYQIYGAQLSPGKYQPNRKFETKDPTSGRKTPLIFESVKYRPIRAVPPYSLSITNSTTRKNVGESAFAVFVTRSMKNLSSARASAATPVP